jgi:hypothetical protein
VSEDKTGKIADLNDQFRWRVGAPAFGAGVPGLVVCTRGVAALPPEMQIAVWFAVRNFKDFSEDNDPRGERDFGAFEIEGVAEKLFWKIDYYADRSCAFGADDPADMTRSFRVLTIMLASEY